MAHLREAMLNGDDEPSSYSNTRDTTEVISELLAEGANTDGTLLKAVRSLYIAWNQLLMSLNSQTLFQPPGAEHIKELAEFNLRQLKDATQDISREFAQAGLEWKVQHPEEAKAEELRNLEKSIERQKILIDNTTAALERRLQISDPAEAPEQEL